MIARGATQEKAIEQIDTTDKARAAFVRQYLGLKWPEAHLFHAMFNTGMGESFTATMLIECVKRFERDPMGKRVTASRSRSHQRSGKQQRTLLAGWED